MKSEAGFLAKRWFLGGLAGLMLALTGCGGTPPTGAKAPEAGLDELEAQNKHNLERMKKEQGQR